MNYENQTCPHCGKPLKDGEDVVVCPTCATPQHRECWMEHGRCANDDRHASGFVWKKEEEKKSEPENTGSDSRICPACGSENPGDVLHCGNCGSLLDGGQENPDEPKKCAYCGNSNDSDALHCKYCGAPLNANARPFNDNPFMLGVDMDADERIGDAKAGDVAMFVQAGARRYLPKFKRMAEGKKFSFNFAAFFFAPYWFFLRKINKAGIFFIVLFATSSLMLSGYSTEVVTHLNDFTSEIMTFDYANASDEQADEYDRRYVELQNQFIEDVKKPLLIISAVNLLLRLICALCANKLYYRKIIADLKLINDNVSEDTLKRVMLAKRGGISAIGFAGSLLGYNLLINMLVYAADLMMNSF